MRKCRILSVMLALSLGVGLLSGCGTKGMSGSLEQDSTAGESGTEGTGSTVNGNNDKTLPESDLANVAMGRYVETELTLPEELDGNSLTAFFRGKDGVLEMYAITPYVGEDEPRKTKRFTWDGNTWQIDEAFGRWLDEKSRTEIALGRIANVAYGQDGNYYISVIDDDYIGHLYRLEEDGEVQELLADAFLPPAGSQYGLLPSQVDVTENGDILIHSYSEVHSYRADGAKLFTITKFESGMSDYSIGFAEGNDFVTHGENGHVVRYDVATGSKKDDIVYDNMEGIGHTQVLAGDGNGGIFVLNRTGLAHISNGGSLWELLIDGSLNSIGMNNLNIRAMACGDDRDYYVAFGINGGGIKICHYTYDPDMATVPPSTLTVYSLQENTTISQAASVFQVHHPEVRVEVRTAASQNGDVTEETIRALNTELLSGQGADVLVLDGLPMDSYVEKGVLLDMREVFEQIQQTAPILENVCGNFTEKDGSVYMMPARISVPIIIGEKEAVNAFKTLDGMAGYAGDHTLVGPDTYENLLRQAAALHYQELFGSDGNVDRNTLIRYLEAVKAVGEAAGAKTVFTEEEMERLYTTNRVMPYGIKGSGVYYDMGICDLGVDRLEGMFDMMVPAAIAQKRPQAMIGAIENMYFPAVLVGINQDTKIPELAMEFVKCVFSDEIQKENFYDGFPVELTSLEKQCEEDKPGISTGQGFHGSDYRLSAGWPTEEYRQMVHDMIVHVSVPVILDETLMGMIVSGSRDYYDGKISAQQAAGAIEQQIMLYRAEQG